MLEHELAHAVVKALQDFDHLLRLGTVRHGGEVAEVAEEACDVSPVRVEQVCVLLGHDEFCHLRRQKLLQSAESVDLVVLALDRSRHVAVEGLDFLRLLPDRAVQGAEKHVLVRQCCDDQQHVCDSLDPGVVVQVECGHQHCGAGATERDGKRVRVRAPVPPQGEDSQQHESPHQHCLQVRVDRQGYIEDHVGEGASVADRERDEAGKHRQKAERQENSELGGVVRVRRYAGPGRLIGGYDVLLSRHAQCLSAVRVGSRPTIDAIRHRSACKACVAGGLELRTPPIG